MRLAVERLSTIFDSLDYHVAMYDREWRYTYLNREAARLLGRSPEELIGRSIWEVFPEAIGNQYYREVHEARDSGRIIHSDHFYPPFGRWYENHIYPLPDGVMVLSRDVTPERTASEALRQRETMLRLAQQAGGVATFKWDIESGIAECSPELFVLFGLTPRDGGMTAQEWGEHLHPEDRGALLAQVRRALAGEEPARADYRVIKVDGQVRWHSYAGQVHRTPSGRLLMLGTVVDITDRKSIEDRLAEANRLKDEFLATLSHELRTPLNVIRGRTNMLSMAADMETVRQTAEIIDRNSRMLEKLVSDLLDVSRITLGRVDLECQVLELASIAQAAVQAAQVAAGAKHLELTVEVPAGLFVWGDSTRLQQVVWNVLNNAVKFTPAGGRVGVTACADGEHIALAVSDSGVGIQPELLPHIFEMFRHGASTTTRDHGGLGLGLSIARKLVELHGGDIRAESPGAGRGARVTIRLPRAGSGLDSRDRTAAEG